MNVLFDLAQMTVILGFAHNAVYKVLSGHTTMSDLTETPMVKKQKSWRKDNKTFYLGLVYWILLTMQEPSGLTIRSDIHENRLTHTKIMNDQFNVSLCTNGGHLEFLSLLVVSNK